MNVSLTAELERWIQAKVDGGLYRSSSEVVRDALRRMRELEESRSLHLEALRQDLVLGLEQLDRGESVAFDLDDVLRRGRAAIDAS